MAHSPKSQSVTPGIPAYSVCAFSGPMDSTGAHLTTSSALSSFYAGPPVGSRSPVTNSGFLFDDGELVSPSLGPGVVRSVPV